VVQPDAHEQVGVAQERELTGMDLPRVRVLARVAEALDAHAVATDDGDEIAQVGGARRHGERRRHQQR
jgi:hypothetical protein